MVPPHLGARFGIMSHDLSRTAQNHDTRPQAPRSTRLAGKARSTNPVTIDRDPGQWIEIPVPPLIDETTFQRAARRLDDNKRFATRNSTTPSLFKGLVARRACSYAYYRTSTTTSKRKIVYYRCIGSDSWGHQGGKICDARPIRADPPCGSTSPGCWPTPTSSAPNSTTG